MGAPIVHWEINAKDAKKTQEFFGALFGWTINADNPYQYGMVDTGSTVGIGGGIGQADPNVPVPNVTVYVQVEDPEACLAKVVELGGKVVRPVTEISGMVTFALFADPEGNTIGLLKGTTQEQKPARRKRVAPSRKKPRARGKAAFRKGKGKKSGRKR